MSQYGKDHEIDGADYLVFVSADQNDQPPSKEFCMQYADSTGVDPAKMLIDPDFAGLFSNVDSGQSGGVGLPWDGVVRGDGMILEWNPAEPGSPQAVMDALLDE